MTTLSCPPNIPAVFWYMVRWYCWPWVTLDVVLCARERYVTSRLGSFQRIYVYVCLPAYDVSVYACMSAYVSAYICMYACMFMHMYVSAYICMPAYVCAYVLCMYACMCLCALCAYKSSGKPERASEPRGLKSLVIVNCLETAGN